MEKLTRLMLLLALLFVVVGCSDDDGGDPTQVTTGRFTIFYYTTWATPYIHYNAGSGWTTSPGKAMTKVNDTWYKYVFTEAESTQALTFVFNNGSGTWDNNNNANYSYTAVPSTAIYVGNGQIIPNGSLTGTSTVLIHYKSSDAFSGTPTLHLWQEGQTGVAVAAVSNTAYGPVYAVPAANGGIYKFKFYEGTTWEPAWCERNLGLVITSNQFWVWKEHRALFDTDPSVSVIADPATATVTNSIGATIDGGNVHFVFFANNRKSVGVSINSGAVTDMKLTSDGKLWWTTQSAAAGNTYLFRMDGTTWVTDPYAAKVGNWNSTYNCEYGVIVNQTFSWSGFTTPNMQDLIIYEMHVGDFTEDTSSGVAERGKYSGVTEKLTYLTNLGINCIELMPISHFQGGASFFSWGYMTRLFFAPSTRYAGAGDIVTDLKTLVDEAHKRGVAVILDMVYNHAENDPNYLWRIDNEYYFNPWGLKAGGVGYNNINSTRPMAVRLIADNMKYFMEQFKIDGFRLDLTGGNENAPSGETAIDHGTLQTIAGQLKAINPNVILIAENWGATDNTLASWSKWEGGFKSDLPAVLNSGNDNVAKYVWGNRDSGRFTKPTESIMYICSHDEHSIYNYTTTDQLKKAKHGAAILLTAMAVPMLWMGEEMGDSYWNETISKPLDWGQLTTRAELFEYYRGLIAIRKAHQALRPTVFPDGTGVAFRWNVTPGSGWVSYTPAPVNSTSGALGYVMNYDGAIAGKRVFVLHNYSGVSKTLNNIPLPVDGVWNQVADGTNANPSGIGGSVTAASGVVPSINIPAKTSYIYLSP